MNKHPQKQINLILKRWLFISWLCVAMLLLTSSAQSAVDSKTMWQMINRARAANDVELLAWNDLLAQAAQLHAADIANRNDKSDIGSDGSSAEERVARLGYASYPDGVRMSEIWSTGSAIEVMAFFLQDEFHRDNLLLPIWREVGVAQAESVLGSRLWVVVFGAAPGNFPLFINDDEEQTTESTVTITLRREEAGYSEEVFTTPVQMRLGEALTITDMPWVPWQPSVQFELSPEGGEKLVIAEIRDTIGHTIVSTDTIYFVSANHVLPTEALQLAPTLTPTHTATNSPTATMTPVPTVTPTASTTMTPIPTPTPIVSATPASTVQSLLEASHRPLLFIALIIFALALIFALIFMLLLRLLRRY